MSRILRPRARKSRSASGTLLAVLAAVAGIAGTASGKTTPYLNFPPTSAGALPATLSQTGAFADPSTLTVSAGIVPFQVNQPLWSDDAGKLRWIAVPIGSGITFSPTGNWQFPAGTVLIKHFEIGEERHRLETRFTIITDGGGSYYLTYKWRADNTDADLLPAHALTESITLRDGTVRKWTYPSRTGCLACHQDSSDNRVLGPKTRQLNMDAFDPGSGTVRNQLVTFNQLGLFESPIDENEIPSYEALRRITDETASIEERVRAYLDVNCAMCHNAISPPSTAAPFDVRYHTPLEETGVINGPLFIGAGVPGGRVIKPQDPARSLMHTRLATNDPEERMPPLGRDVVHAEARDLILEWLLSLDPVDHLDALGYQSRWRFNGDLADETGAADGVWRDAPNAAVFGTGQEGQAVSLPGGADAVDLGSYDVTGSGITIALWINANSFSAGEDVFIARSTGNQDADFHWSVSAVSGSQLRFRLKLGGTTSTLTSTSGILAEEMWTHVCATYDGTMLRLYRDGSEVAFQPASGTVDSHASAEAAIGNLPPSAGSAPFDGRIDDLRIYARGLGPGDVNRVRDVGLVQNEAPAVTIDEPAPGGYVIHQSRVDFSGSSVDPEEGNLSEDIEWFSSLDGVFGSGASLSWKRLSVGEHLIALVSQDMHGVASADSISLTIVPGLETYLEDYGLAKDDLDPLADTDGDRRSQLAEYAFLSSPLAANGSAVEATAHDAPGLGRFPAVAFAVSKLAIDLEYVVQVSTDLRTWTDAGRYAPRGADVAYTPGAGSVMVSALDEGDTVRVVERAATANAEGPFLRVVTRLVDD